ncbi:hypothetical protein [Pseudolysinimonas sp.]|uniref:hypothetical protein n=1 Tax=Pseudolysinimonas sp. TaxID=2680009 RepID=UPI003F80E9FC
MPDDPKRIDPRYDPAFQRGYRGDVRTQPRGESALRRTPPADPHPAHERSAATSPAPAMIPGPPAPAPVPTAAEPVGTAVVPHASEPTVPPEVSATPRDVTRNPFYLAAGALAVLLIVGGAVWLGQGFAAIADGRAASVVGYYAAATMTVGAPLLMGIGVLIIAGLLFVLARSWRPRDEA